MEIDIGRMNKRITFYKSDGNGVDQYNRTVKSYKEHKTVWASVEPMSGKEYLEADRNANEQNYKIYTRYYPDLREVNLVIGYKGRKFQIQSVINYRESNEMLLFMCVERIGEKIE